MFKKFWQWIKTHIVIFIVGLFIIISAIIIPIIIINIDSKEANFELAENLEFELDSDIYLLSLIKRVSNAEILTENNKIDTSKLGEQKIKVLYLDNKNKKKEYIINIKIIDTVKPTIEYKKELTTSVGNKIDLLKDVVVTDNSKEEIKAVIEGTYDFNKTGTYNLKYVAVDSSGNKTEEDFILTVKNATIKTNGAYYRSNGGKILFISFNKNKKVFVDYDTGCTVDMPCGGYTEYGTYSINDNKITITLTHGFDLDPELDSFKLEKPKKSEYIIINENQIKNDNKIYKFKK